MSIDSNPTPSDNSPVPGHRLSSCFVHTDSDKITRHTILIMASVGNVYILLRLARCRARHGVLSGRRRRGGAGGRSGAVWREEAGVGAVTSCLHHHHPARLHQPCNNQLSAMFSASLCGGGLHQCVRGTVQQWVRPCDRPAAGPTQGPVHLGDRRACQDLNGGNQVTGYKLYTRLAITASRG